MPASIEFSLPAHFAFALQLSLGIVFLLSTFPKLRHPFAFAQSVVEYEILPTNVARSFGLALMLGEAFLAGTLLTNWVTDVALLLAAVMLVAFLVAVGINLRQGRKIACGCFGDANEQISPRTAARLLLLLAVVLLLMAFHSTAEPVLPALAAMITVPSALNHLLQTLFLAVFLLVLGAWLLNLPELVHLVRYGHSPPRPPENSSARGAAPSADFAE